MVKKEEFNLYEFHRQLQQTVTQFNESYWLDKKEKILKQTNHRTYSEELQYQKDLKDIQTHLDTWYENETFSNLADINVIIKEYYELLNCTIKNSFMKKKKIVPDEEIMKRKIELVEQYLFKIKPFPLLFSHLPSFYDAVSLKICNDCHVELEAYEHNLICPECCCEQTSIQSEELVTFKDLSRINTNIKYSYIRQTHFKDTIKQFQGKQNKYIDESVYDILYSCFNVAGLHKNDLGKYTSVTKDHIKMFLQENGLYKYYEDMNLIYHVVTGTPCPNIEPYEKQLINDFDKLIVIYDKVIKEDASNYERSNFLNSYYVLFQLLKKNSFPCKESDFPIIKTIDRKIEHDEIYEKCCKQLGWFFYATV